LVFVADLYLIPLAASSLTLLSAAQLRADVRQPQEAAAECIIFSLPFPARTRGFAVLLFSILVGLGEGNKPVGWLVAGNPLAVAAPYMFRLLLVPGVAWQGRWSMSLSGMVGRTSQNVLNRL